MPSALLLVRAELKDSGDRAAFDHWYQSEHLPAALEAFGAEHAWRCWASTTPPVHYAFYRFGDVSSARSVLGSREMAGLIAEFDRSWGARTARSREILEIVQELSH